MAAPQRVVRPQCGEASLGTRRARTSSLSLDWPGVICCLAGLAGDKAEGKSAHNEWMMEIRQLRHFVSLAEEMHFGRSAKQLCITQPALSISIGKLEDELGLRLFERDRNGVRLTVSGELMLERAREILNYVGRASSFSASIAAGRLGRIEVGFSTPILTDEVERLLESCRANLPQLDVVMREATSQKQVELLMSGRLDAGLVSFPRPPAGLEFVELFEDRFVLCLSASHPLARRPRLSLSELHSEPFIFPSREGMPSIHDQLMGLCASAGFQPRVSYESQHALSTVALVARRLGIGFVLEAMISRDMPGVAFVQLDQPLPRRCAYFVWRKDRQAPGLQAVAEPFIAYARRSRLRKTNRNWRAKGAAAVPELSSG